jgi:hypothetical protein
MSKLKEELEEKFIEMMDEYDEFMETTYSDLTKREQAEAIANIKDASTEFFKKIPNEKLKKKYKNRFSKAIRETEVLKEYIVNPKQDPSILGNAIRVKTKTHSKRGGKRNNRTKKYRNKSKSNKQNRKI